MAGKLVNEGEHRFLDILFGSQAVDANLYLGLYENDTEPPETATLTDLTEQAVGLGYARIGLARGTWVVTDDHADYAQQIFTANGGAWGEQYGYFVCTCASGTAGKLIHVEHFSDGPYDVADTDSVKVTPKITAI